MDYKLPVYDFFVLMIKGIGWMQSYIKVSSEEQDETVGKEEMSCSWPEW